MFSTILTKFLECFLYLLKTVEIVIIQASGGDFIQNEATNTESIGKPTAHFLCAVFVGGH